MEKNKNLEQLKTEWRIIKNAPLRLRNKCWFWWRSLLSQYDEVESINGFYIDSAKLHQLNYWKRVFIVLDATEEEFAELFKQCLTDLKGPIGWSVVDYRIFYKAKNDYDFGFYNVIALDSEDDSVLLKLKCEHTMAEYNKQGFIEI